MLIVPQHGTEEDLRARRTKAKNKCKRGGSFKVRTGETYISSADEYSAGLCDMPSLQRMKIIDVGQRRAVWTLYMRIISYVTYHPTSKKQDKQQKNGRKRRTNHVLLH